MNRKPPLRSRSWATVYSQARGFLFPLKSSLSRSLRAETSSLTVPLAGSYPPLLNAGRESWSYNAITANTPFVSTRPCRAVQHVSPANRSCEGEPEDTTTWFRAVHKVSRTNFRPESQLLAE